MTRTVSYTFTATDQAGHQTQHIHDVEVSGAPSVRGQDLHRFYGACAHANWNAGVYGNTNAWTQDMADLGAYSFRSLLAHNLPHVQTAVTRARALGLKWHALIVPEANDMTEAAILARLAWIDANASDVVKWIFGVNEPFESERPFTDARARAVVRTQFLLWWYVWGRANGGAGLPMRPNLAHVRVGSATMHAVYTTNQMYADFATIAESELLAIAGTAPANAVWRQRWEEAGRPTRWRDLCDVFGMHYYTGGREFGYEWATRTDRIRNNWGPNPILIDETGFTNALNRPSGHNPVSEAAADKYALRWLHEAYDVPWIAGIRRYELEDDPDPEKDDIESNFGMRRCPSTDPATWTNKPEFDTMQTGLALLRDPDPSFMAYDVPAIIEAPPEVRWRITTTSDKPPVVWFWRPGTSVWDVSAKTDLSVAPLQVHVVWPGGDRTLNVSGRTNWLSLT